MLFYPAALPLSSRTLNYTAGVIRRYRSQIGSCWRKLNPGIDRVAANRPFYSGKHRHHGMNLQVISARTARSCGSLARCPGRCMT